MPPTKFNKKVGHIVNVKRSKNGSTTLYVVVDQNQIPLKSIEENKKTEVVKTTASPEVKSSASRSVAYSISQVIPFVNMATSALILTAGAKTKKLKN